MLPTKAWRSPTDVHGAARLIGGAMQTDIPELDALLENPRRTAWTAEMEAQMREYYRRCAEAGMVADLVESLNERHGTKLSRRAVYNKAISLGLAR